MKLRLALLAVVASRALFAVDGQVLITQASITASGGFPYRITESGSYKLGGNLVAPLNAGAISIQANDVVIDLNGYNLKCSFNQAAVFQAGCISDNFAQTTGTVVRNGSIEVNAIAPTFNFIQFVVGLSLSKSVAATIEKVHFDGTTTNFSASGEVTAGRSILRYNLFTGSASPSIACPSVVEGNVNATLGAGSSGTGCVGSANVGLIAF